MHLKLFNFRLLLSLQLRGNIHTAPFNSPTSAQQTGYGNVFPSLLRYIDVLCFQHMMAAVREKKNKKLFVLLQVRFHNDWIHMQTFPRALYVKIISKIPGSQLCKHKRRCLMWVRGLRAHRRTGVPRLFIWVVVRLQE